MNKKHQSELKSSARDFLRSDKLQVITIKNGLILPAHENSSKLWADGGVIDEKGNFVELSGNGYIFGGKYDYDEAEVKYVDEEVVFFGPFIKHWGHFICDQIGRLWYIKNNPQKYKIAYCGWNWRQGPGDLDGNYLELLELLGCKKSQFRAFLFRWKLLHQRVRRINRRHYQKCFSKQTKMPFKNLFFKDQV